MPLTKKQEQAMRLLSAKSDKRFLLDFGGARSGKTYKTCRAWIIRAGKYAGSRQCIVRDSQASCISSVWTQTFEPLIAEIMPNGGYEIKQPKGLPKICYFANGAQIWSGGFDNKAHEDAILGQEWQGIFVNEATDASYRIFKKLKTRLNKQAHEKIPLKMVLDCNPTTPTHWLAQYFVEGIDPDEEEKVDAEERALCDWLHYSPKDNRENLDETTLKTLERLTGMERKRFWEGVWANNFVGQVFYAFSRENNIPQTPPKHDVSCEQWMTWDFGIGDYAVVIFLQIRKIPTSAENPHGVIIEIYDEYVNSQQPPEHYGEVVSTRYDVSRFSATGDPAGGSRHESTESWVDRLRKFGIDIEYGGLHGTSIKDYVSEANRYIPCVRINERACPQVVKAFENWSYPLDKSGKVPDGAKPIHNEHSHACTAFYYFVQYYFTKLRKPFKPFAA